MKTKFSFYKSVLIALCLALLVFSVALAASGGLDKTFSGDGKIIQNFGGVAHAGYDIAIQSDGKVVVVGEKWLSNGGSDFAIARYRADGALDKTFSGDGMQVIDFSPADKDLLIDEALSVAIQTNGKIVVGGQTCTSGFVVCKVALARLNANGALDTRFGESGKVTFPKVNSEKYGGYNLALYGNKIVVAGYQFDGNDYNGAVYRFNADGTLDLTFSKDGILPIDFGKDDFLNAIAIESGKIYVAGTSRLSNGVSSDFIVARINANGALDTTFGGDGKAQTGLGVTDGANSLVVSNGKVIVAGYSDKNIAIAQYTASGDLDTSFSGDGIVSVNGALASPSVAGVGIQSGKIIVAGRTDRTSLINGDAFLMRYTASGKWDSTFGAGGLVVANWSGGDGYNAVAFKNNRIYVVGTSKTTAGVNRFIVARYLP